MSSLSVATEAEDHRRRMITEVRTRVQIVPGKFNRSLPFCSISQANADRSQANADRFWLTIQFGVLNISLNRPLTLWAL